MQYESASPISTIHPGISRLKDFKCRHSALDKSPAIPAVLLSAAKVLQATSVAENTAQFWQSAWLSTSYLSLEQPFHILPLAVQSTASIGLPLPPQELP